MSTVIRKVQWISTCLAASVVAATLAGCGGSSSSTTTPPPVTASLSGTYVLSANGDDATDGLYDVAGVLTFDGSGNIKGVADYNLGSGIDMNVPLTGSYTLAGTAALVTLTDGAKLQDTFTLAIAASGPLTVAGFDGSGSGTLTPQTAGSTFTTNGTYSYTLAGQGNNTLTSTGGFVSANGTITSGTQTNTDGSAVFTYGSITGILEPVQADGRGQAAFGDYTFGYYPVTATQIVLIGLDDRALLYGTATKM